MKNVGEESKKKRRWNTTKVLKVKGIKFQKEDLKEKSNKGRKEETTTEKNIESEGNTERVEVPRNEQIRRNRIKSKRKY